MGVPKVSDHIQVKIKMLNPSQEPPAPTKAQNQGWKDMDVLCTFKIKIENKDLKYGCIKDQWPFSNQDKMTNPSHQPPAPTKAQNQDLKDMDVLCTFKIKGESQNLYHWYINDQWPF